MKLCLLKYALPVCFLLTLFCGPRILAKAPDLVLKSHTSILIDELNGGAFPYSLLASPSGKMAYTTTSSQDGFLITKNFKRFPLSTSQRLKNGFSLDEKFFIVTGKARFQSDQNQVLIHRMSDGQQTLLPADHYFEGILSDSVTGIFSVDRKLVLKRIDTGKVVQEIPLELPQINRSGSSFRNDVLVSPKRNRWASLIGQRIIKIYETGKKAALLERSFVEDEVSPYMFFTDNGDHLFLNINRGIDRNWQSFNLQTKREGCALEIPSGFSIHHLAAAGDQVVGNLKPKGTPYCDESFAGQCRLVTWELNSCKITRNITSYASNFFQTAWIDKDHLLLIGDYGYGDVISVANFLTGEIKSSYSIDGSSGLKVTLSKTSRDIFAISLAIEHPGNAMRFFKVSFDSLLQ